MTVAVLRRARRVRNVEGRVGRTAWSAADAHVGMLTR